ncbi:hypothetical protein NC653_034701 [Populus alba x Populus x berolinensis]|uniref:Uncharacterized protein n=1 Tax=Populus alba x Populus x berolinensis TaxID=444605 RepID=A0AAD6LNC3_9ROSI|nr:hypothetical protein NC653_034701 [Populus alba x Populus x berolinensis]
MSTEVATSETRSLSPQAIKDQSLLTPSKLPDLETMRKLFRCRLKPFVTSSHQIRDPINRLYFI